VKKKPTTEAGLLVELWPIDRPRPYEKNARRLSDRAVDVLAASLREFGWRQPIVVDADGVIIAGHTRLLAARKLGMETVPVHVATGLTPAQVRAYRLMDNRSAEETSWDASLLEEEIAELQQLEADLSLTGFSEFELEKLLQDSPKSDEDSAPEAPAIAVSRPGDMWLLGNHRLLAGDATDTEAVARLIAGRKADLVVTDPADQVDGEEPESEEVATALATELATDERADLVFTDPPYNVDYQGYTKKKLKIQKDNMTREEFAKFLRAAFASYAGAIKPAASVYVCHAAMNQREFQDAMEAAGLEVRCQIIWAKNIFAWGFGRYKWQHEPIFYAHKQGTPDKWFGDKTQSTLWQAAKPAANRMHPTMKPIELIEHALENSSQPGGVVLDLFGGSGSTLIACEKHGRRARLMELDPRYADVIVVRWEQYTGRKARLEDGREFADVAKERANAEDRT
jgi:DNA modification methylase